MSRGILSGGFCPGDFVRGDLSGGILSRYRVIYSKLAAVAVLVARIVESLFIRFRQAVIQRVSEFDETLLKH